MNERCTARTDVHGRCARDAGHDGLHINTLEFSFGVLPHTPTVERTGATMTGKVYIAAPYEFRERAQTIMRVLGVRGLEVTSTWLRETHVVGADAAMVDLDDVRRADVMLLLNPEGWERQGTGGRHAELGAALALEMSVVLVGERSNVFHYHPRVTQVDDGGDFSKAILAALALKA